MLSALEALQRLREGNRRFVSGLRSLESLVSPVRRDELLEEQQPFAVILGCSDSRVPAETIFDQGLGDLFVIRVAGNIVAPSQAGSIEFAVERFGTRLVVVLGHTRCGAIHATLEDILRPNACRSNNLLSIVNRIRPQVEALFEQEQVLTDLQELERMAVRANVRAATQYLRLEDEVLRPFIERDGLLIVGAEYSLETGIVDFFDVPPNVQLDGYTA